MSARCCTLQALRPDLKYQTGKEVIEGDQHFRLICKGEVESFIENAHGKIIY